MFGVLELMGTRDCMNRQNSKIMDNSLIQKRDPTHLLLARLARLQRQNP